MTKQTTYNPDEALRTVIARRNADGFQTTEEWAAMVKKQAEISRAFRMMADAKRMAACRR